MQSWSNEKNWLRAKECSDQRPTGVISSNMLSLVDSMSRHLVKSRSQGTVSKYYGAFKRWEPFITAENGCSTPAEPIHVALYLTHLLDNAASTSVIQSAVYSIKWAYNIRGLRDPTDNHYVTNLLESSKRQSSKPVIKKDVVSSEQIVLLCDKYSESSDVLVLRDLSIIVLCFAGCLRFDESSSLRCTDISFHDTYLSLFISKSETDQYRHGNFVVINQGCTSACPLSILKRYINCSNISLHSDHFLFKPALRTGKVCSLIHKNKPISYTRARETVVARLKEVCGSSNIGLHSMRASGASMAARSGVNERCLW